MNYTMYYVVSIDIWWIDIHHYNENYTINDVYIYVYC